MRVDGDGRLAEGDVEHDVGGLAPDTRQALQRLAVARHLPAMLFDELSAERDDVLRLGVEQADRADVVAQTRLAERDHLLRRVGHLEQRPRRSEEHKSELQSIMRISYAVFCLKKKK